MNISSLTLGIVDTNCYFLSNDQGTIIVDPADNAEVIISHAKEIGLPVEGILLTHTHFDHIAALDEVAYEFDVGVYVAAEEREWLRDAELNGSLKLEGQGLKPINSDIDATVIGEGEHQVGSYKFQVLHLPGHSPGSLGYYFKDEEAILSGDVLFNKGVGRTDLRQGDFNTLMRSIKDKLFALDESVEIYPGHGPATTIGEEKETNPHIFN